MIMDLGRKTLRALHDHVLVEDMNFRDRKLSSGILLPADNGKSSGIRPRWGRVYAVGPQHRDVMVGQWICVAHGRWTRGIEIQDSQGTRTIRRIDPDDILLVSDQEPRDDTMSDAISVPERG
jgi:co-chaperonin GroES (HSP10)